MREKAIQGAAPIPHRQAIVQNEAHHCRCRRHSDEPDMHSSKSVNLDLFQYHTTLGIMKCKICHQLWPVIIQLVHYLRPGFAMWEAVSGFISI